MKERKGYVFEANGRWFARITITDPATGKRRNIKRTARSKSSAKALLKQLSAQLQGDGIEVIESLQMTVNHLAEHYLAKYAIPAKFVGDQKIDGLRDYRRLHRFVGQFCALYGSRKLRNTLYSDFAAYRLLRLRTPTQYKKQRTITTVNRELSCLRRMFNVAVRKGWIVKNPFNCGEPLILASCEKRRERVLTSTEEVQLLAACGNPKRHHLKPLLIALLDTGARLGEMLKLTWGDVDLHARMITIQARNTKTLRERQVCITERLHAQLIELWEKAGRRDEARSLVFGIHDNVRRSFATACRLAGIKHGGLDGLTLHCLRHTAATRLVKGQLSIQLVGRILGHTQVSTTYRYLTVDAETARHAASILDKYQTASASSG